MTPELEQIRKALKAGDKATARALLPPLVKEQPTPDLWTLAAQACETKEDALKCLRKALHMDAYHSRANSLMLKLDDLKPPTRAEWEQMTGGTLPMRFPVEPMPLKKVGHKRRMTHWRWVSVISFMLLGSACSLFTLNMVGLINGMFTTATVLLGGPTPVSVYQGVPLGQLADAPAIVPSSHREQIGVRTSEDDHAVTTTGGGQDADVLENGYLHEYTFDAASGNEYAVYIQFLSFAANRVSRNVVVLRPDGSDATPNCQRDHILAGDNNIALICNIDVTGTWNVRILGRNGESVGAYFIGIERMQRS